MTSTVHSKRRRNQSTEYLCSGCGFTTRRWMGFCPQCRRDEALVQSLAGPRSAGASLRLREISQHRDLRRATGMAEFDRVLGGGIVPGSVILVGGEPGVGKSTLLLQLADSVAQDGVVALASPAEPEAFQPSEARDFLDALVGEVVELKTQSFNVRQSSEDL